MGSAGFLNNDEIKKNILAVQQFIKDHKADAIYISSFDPYLNEYVPLEDCHRYYLTGFTGSTADVIIPAEGKVRLIVDGRYHEQVDQEVDLDLVEPYKRGQDEMLYNCFKSIQTSLNANILMIESTRTPLAFEQNFKSSYDEVISLNDELSEIIHFHSREKLPPINFVEQKFRGADTVEKLNKVVAAEEEALFVTALDNLAWLANCRGYHLPFQSTFLGRGLATKNKLYIFVDSSTPISQEALDQEHLEFKTINIQELPVVLKQICEDEGIAKIKYDAFLINSYDYHLIAQAVGEQNLLNEKDTVYAVQSLKDDQEIAEMVRSFEKSNQAIYETLKETKERIDNGERFSEVDLYDLCFSNYQKHGAVGLSFNTIPGIAANSSIIHYGNPSADMTASLGDLILLDSGAYYEGGFATDTTRTITAGSSQTDVSPEAKKYYTLVLKGVLQTQNAEFSMGTLGKEVDVNARAALKEAGLDFAHGTGHGVGINVHEPGVRISTTSEIPMKPRQVTSIEPGYYVPGFGGIRIENVCYVVEKDNGLLGFENMTWIGYEPLLIDFSLLTQSEKQWIDEHETECAKRGRSFFTSDDFEKLRS